YGDEIGMTGGMDPDCRRTMNWTNQDKDLLAYYHKLIKARKSHSALRTGEWKTLMRHNDRGQLVYLRSDAQSQCLTFMNKGNQTSVTLATDGTNLAKTTIQDGTVFTDVLSGKSYTVQNGKLTVAVAPASGTLLVSK
ncbi:MAG: hypothetical protein ACM3YO_00565, partial [Bacteroidota bacterium]